VRLQFLTAVSIQAALGFWYVTLLTVQRSSYKNIFFVYVLRHLSVAYIEIWCGNLRERDRLGDPGIDGRIILKCIFRKWDEGNGLDRAGSG
jgi:hypothetical protein